MLKLLALVIGLLILTGCAYPKAGYQAKKGNEKLNSIQAPD